MSARYTEQEMKKMLIFGSQNGANIKQVTVTPEYKFKFSHYPNTEFNGASYHYANKGPKQTHDANRCEIYQYHEELNISPSHIGYMILNESGQLTFKFKDNFVLTCPDMDGLKEFLGNHVTAQIDKIEKLNKAAKSFTETSLGFFADPDKVAKKQEEHHHRCCSIQ